MAADAGEIGRLRVALSAEPGQRLKPGTALPGAAALEQLRRSLESLAFPGYFGAEPELIELGERLRVQCQAAFASPHEREQRGADAGAATPRDAAVQATGAFLAALPGVRRLLAIDVRAAYDRDPASRSLDEIVLCYPGVRALCTHRLANAMWQQGVPIIPRAWAEMAHRETGIDIHPGASIGEGFFIDHGTGVVIGETTVIGRNCTIYQGVTLGAARFEQDAHGALVRNTKRHPTLEDGVTIYAGATVLGGDTVLGAGCIVNGGLFVTSSIPPGHIARAPRPEVTLRSRDGR